MSNDIVFLKLHMYAIKEPLIKLISSKSSSTCYEWNYFRYQSIKQQTSVSSFSTNYLNEFVIFVTEMTEGSDNNQHENACPIASAATTTDRPMHQQQHLINNNKIISEQDPVERKSSKEPTDYDCRYRWPDLIVQLFIHVGCLYGLYLCLVSARFYTTLFGKLYLY